MKGTFTYTSDFQSEFISETTRLLRRRMLWFLGLSLFVTLWQWPLSPTWVRSVWHGLLDGSGGGGDLWTAGLLTAIDFAVCFALLMTVIRRPLERDGLIRIAFWFLLYRGFVAISNGLMERDVGFPYSIMVFHVLAASLLPWSPREALRPMGVLLACNAAAMIGTADDFQSGALFALVTPLAAVPGVAIAWLKHGRRIEKFKINFLQNRYGQMRQELVDARRIHESLFPRPQTDGPIRFDYRYEPMRQIGGDYIFTRFSPANDGEKPAFNLLLIDVTGHGIAAALTVNRLCGEVERLYAEDPGARPGDVLRALNRYVHLTIATHSVYATALCARFDAETNRLEYANGGHPPAFLRAVDGSLTELSSTAFVLGACADCDFDSAPVTVDFGPGDTMVAYTDGATEARDAQGKMLRVAGIQRAMAGPQPGRSLGWAGRILDLVETHREGPPADDTLVVEVSRHLATRAELGQRHDTTEGLATHG